MRTLLTALLFHTGASANGEVIDRIAVTVEHRVITLSQIFDEIRLTAFLNHEAVDLSSPQKRRAAERLIEQTLMRREMDLTHYPLPKAEDAEPVEKEVEAKFASRAAFEEDLRKYEITEAALKEHLWWELAAVRFIDYRFRPGLQIPEDDLKDYYQKKLAEWKEKGVQPVPSFEDSRAAIEEALLKERANQALDLWLGEVRTQISIVYHQEALQ